MPPEGSCMTHADDHEPSVSFEEFRLYYELTEKVTDRRLELSRSNSSLCTLVIAGLGVTCAWTYDKGEVLPIALAVVAFIAILGVLFCYWWFKQIEFLQGSERGQVSRSRRNSRQDSFPGPQGSIGQTVRQRMGAPAKDAGAEALQGGLRARRHSFGIRRAVELSVVFRGRRDRCGGLRRLDHQRFTDTAILI